MCREQTSWLTRSELTGTFGVAEPHLAQLQEQALKEIKEMELKKHSEELMAFLSFRDLLLPSNTTIALEPYEETKQCLPAGQIETAIKNKLDKIPEYNFYQ